MIIVVCKQSQLSKKQFDFISEMFGVVSTLFDDQRHDPEALRQRERVGVVRHDIFGRSYKVDGPVTDIVWVTDRTDRLENELRHFFPTATHTDFELSECKPS